MENLKQKLKETYHYDDAVFLEESKKFDSLYLQDSVYLVQKNGLRGAVAAGAARISEILKCDVSTKEEIQRLTKQYCKHLCSTFTDYSENEIHYFGPDNERRGRIIEKEKGKRGGIFIQIQAVQ